MELTVYFILLVRVCLCHCRVRVRFNVINSLLEDVFAQFENMEGGQEDTDDDASSRVRLIFSSVMQCILVEN